MLSITCKFPVIGEVLITFKDRGIYSFTKRQFSNYLIDERGKIKEENKSFVSLIFKDIESVQIEKAVLGRGIVFEKQQFKFVYSSKSHRFYYRYYFDGSKIKISINFNKNFLYFLKNIGRTKYDNFHYLFYKSVLYPIFSIYSIKDGYFLVHGSLVKWKNKYIVFTGLDGVGKSSLAYEMVKEGGKIIGDNFILFNGTYFVGINMPIRLEANKSVKDNVIFKNKNIQEILYPYKENEPIEVQEVYFLAISDNFEKRKLDSAYASLIWQIINQGAGEIKEANIYCMPFLYQNMIKRLENSYSKNISYFYLSVPKGKIQEAIGVLE